MKNLNLQITDTSTMKPFIVAILLSVIASSCSAFTIYPYTNQTYCLTVSGNSNSNQAPFVLAGCTTTAPTATYQQFTSDTTGQKLLSTLVTGNTPPCSPSCLDVVNGTANGARVVQMACNPTRLTQYWSSPATPPLGALPGFNSIQNYWTGRCLQAETLGSYVDIYDCTVGMVQQLWSYTNLDFTVGGYQLQNQVYATNCLAVTGGGWKDGAGTDASGLCSSGAFYQHFGQGFNIPAVYKNTGSGKCMDGGSQPSGTYQYDCSPGARNHQWLTVHFPTDQSFTYSYFVDMLSGLCLTWSSTNVQMAACVQGNVNQQWVVSNP